LSSSLPLYVDLDGTLICSDSLHESLCLLLRYSPVTFLRALTVLPQGRGAFKAAVTQNFCPDVALLPYRPEVLELIRRAHTDGRRVVLATASHFNVAGKIADHLGLFDACLSSDSKRNLKGRVKLEAIQHDCNNESFEYAGDSMADMPIFAAATHSHVVTNKSKLLNRLTQNRISYTHIPSAPVWGAAIAMLRPHQWVKNVLVGVPLLVSFQWSQWIMLQNTLLAFAAMCASASAIYIFNDLADIETDRRHHKKRFRPLASGRISIPTAALAGLLLLLSGLGIAMISGTHLVVTIVLYMICTSLYSLWLKRKLLIDVFMLAGLYVLRVVAGAVATGIYPSDWLIAFCGLWFISLAMAKRFIELRAVFAIDDKEDILLAVFRPDQLAGRGYQRHDLLMLSVLGPVSGWQAGLVYGLYVGSDHVKHLGYRNPTLLWAIVPLLLYWVARLWLLAGRGRLHHDPVVFAIRDRITWGTVFAIAAVLLLAKLW